MHMYVADLSDIVLVYELNTGVYEITSCQKRACDFMYAFLWKTAHSLQA